MLLKFSSCKSKKRISLIYERERVGKKRKKKRRNKKKKEYSKTVIGGSRSRLICFASRGTVNHFTFQTCEVRTNSSRDIGPD
jgi:hypothetical protein